MKEFEKGNTIYFECTYKDFNGEIVDPTSPAYAIINSAGASQASGTPTKKETGVYYFYWTSASVDTFRVEFTGTIGGQAGVARELFRVIETKIK